MTRIRGALEIFQVATDACRIGQRVVIVDMAICARAWWNGVHPSEREPGAAVVERCVSPVTGAVALLTSLRKTRSDVVGICGALEILQMATHARVGAKGKVIVGVAIRALPRRYRVHSREWEIRKIVIKRRVRPVARIVALIASLRKIRSDVVRVRRALEIFQVTCYARRAA